MVDRIRAAILKYPTRGNAAIAKNIHGHVRAGDVERVRATITPEESTPAPIADGPELQIPMVNLSGKTVLNHKPADTILRDLRRIPRGKAVPLLAFAQKIGRPEERVRKEAKRHGAYKCVDLGDEGWQWMVMHPDTAAQFQD